MAASIPLDEKPLPPPKTLSLFDLLCIGVNAIVGSGIYAFPGLLAGLLGPASFLAFVVCGLVGLLVALCFAEAAGMFDRSGGPYIYASAAFGPRFGYLIGWTCWAAAVVSWAAVARALIPYLGHLWSPLGGAGFGTAVAVLITAILGGINYLGLKPGAYTTDLFTVAKLVPLLLLTLFGVAAFSTARMVPFAPLGLGQLPQASFIAFFAFQGFEVVPVPAAESHDPHRNVPLAVIGSLIGTTVLYVVIQIVAVASTPELAGSAEPLALMGRELLGSAGGQLVAGAAVVSMLGFCAGVALTSPRYVEALALDGFLPSAIATRHVRLGTPHRAILLTTSATSALILLFDFGQLVDLSVLTVAVQYISTCAAIPALRLKHPDWTRKFRVPLGATIPIASIAVVLTLMVSQLARQQTDAMFIGFGAMLAIGVLAAGLWWVWERGRGAGR